MIVVNCQPAFVPTTATVPVADTADGASAILLVQQLLVLLSAAT